MLLVNDSRKLKLYIPKGVNKKKTDIANSNIVGMNFGKPLFFSKIDISMVIPEEIEAIIKIDKKITITM